MGVVSFVKCKVNLKQVPRNSFQFVIKKSEKWQEPVIKKNKKRKNIDIYGNIVVFIKLKCLHKRSQLQE